jgi:hypothetical protein
LVQVDYLASFCEHGNEPSLLMDLIEEPHRVNDISTVGCPVVISRCLQYPDIYNRFYASFAFEIAERDERKYQYTTGEKDKEGRSRIRGKWL